MGRDRNGPRANLLARSAVGLVVVLDAVLLGSTVLDMMGIEIG